VFQEKENLDRHRLEEHLRLLQAKHRDPTSLEVLRGRALESARQEVGSLHHKLEKKSAKI
jgi:hypothetical protein